MTSTAPGGVEAAVGEFLSAVCVQPATGGGYVGAASDRPGDYVFGGVILAQAVSAACRTAPEGRRVHSFHGHFLRPVGTGAPLDWAVDTVREGSSFATRQVTGSQGGKAAFTGVASFCADTEGYDYDIPPGSPIPAPEDLAPEPDDGVFEVRPAGPVTEPDGSYRSTWRAWFRTPPLPGDPALHATLLAFLSDITRTSGRPHRLEGTVEGMISLDHAIWFHRPARVDDWLFYDVLPVVNAGGRSMLRGSVYGPDGRLVATMAQEMLLRYP